MYGGLDNATASRGAAPPPGTALDGFCRRLGAALAGVPETEAPARAAALLPRLLADPALIARHQRTVPPVGYGRHCLFVCPHGRFSLLAMVWPPGIRTPVHDHATWCAFGIYEGELEERRYRPGNNALAMETARFVHGPGAVAHLPVDAPDIHSIHNLARHPGISIHVYGGDCTRLGPNIRSVWPVEG